MKLFVGFISNPPKHHLSNYPIDKFYVVRIVHFEVKLYNDQRNAQVLIYLFTSAVHFSGFLLAHLQRQVYVQLGQWFKTPGYGVSARSLKPYPRDAINYTK
jgi:hypothetical protein